MHHVTNWINGEACGDAGFNLVSPATGAVYGLAPDSGVQQVDEAVVAARAALPRWAGTEPAQRAKLVLKLAEALEKARGELGSAEEMATGKPPSALRHEISASADVLRFYAGACRTALGPAAAAYQAGTYSWVSREPVGVVAAITPWNYPLMMASWKLSPALAAGNTVVIKPAPNTPESTRILAELASRAGFPPGVLNVVCGGADTGRALVEHSGLDMVAFTGSVATGREIAARAGLKRIHLELGGNAPVLVFDDADLKAATKDVAAAAFGNAGQSCTAACRVLVHEEVEEEFTQRLLEVTPLLPDGPLQSREQWDRVNKFIAELGPHAFVLAGGGSEKRPGWWYRPTVVAGVHQDDPIVSSEVFGPVVTVQTFSTVAEALKQASSVDQRLAASVYTEDHRFALSVAARLPFGWVGINACHRPVPELPHTGFGDSGRGTDLSVAGLDAYTQQKTITSAM